MVGDTIKFTTLHPYRIQVTGRTKQFINTFGEEVIVDNADEALKQACADTGASIRDYTAGPVYFSDGKAGAHEWIIEFEEPPRDFDRFCKVLDAALRERSEEHTSELQSLMRISYAVFCLKKKNIIQILYIAHCDRSQHKYRAVT